MFEKHNHSNDPSEKQPTLDDGTFTFKTKKASPEAMSYVSSIVKDKDQYDQGKIKQTLSSSNVEAICKDLYGFSDEEFEFIKYALAKNDLLWDDEGNKVEFVKDPDFEKSEDNDDSDLADFIEDEIDDFDDSDLADYISDEEIKDFDDFSFEKVNSGFDELEKKHKQEIEEAEKAMGSEKKGVYEAYKELFELDAAKVEKATDEEFAKLKEAMNIIDKSKEGYKTDVALQNDINNIQTVLDTTFKNVLGYGFNIEQYPEIKDKIPSKIEYYEKLLQEAKANQDIYSANKYQSRINALNKLESVYDKFIKEKEGKESFDKSIEEANAIIAKFQDASSLYSIERHNKAKLLSSNAEARAAYLPEAIKQRKNMTSAETSSLKLYTGNGYSTMNKPLHGIMHNSQWGSKETAKKEAMKMVTNITSALDKCALEKDCTFIRRVGPHMNFGMLKGSDLLGSDKKENLKKLIGVEFKDDSIMSCSANSGIMNSWNEIDMFMYCPKGIKAHYVSDMSSHPDESEIILGRGYHMVVRDAYIDSKTGKPTLKIDVILGSDKDRLTDQQMEELYKKYLY